MSGIPLAVNREYIKGCGSGQRAKSQKPPPCGRRKTLDRVTEGRARNHPDIGVQIPLEPLRIDLAGFTKRPADGLVNQIVGVRVQAPREPAPQAFPAAAASAPHPARPEPAPREEP